MLPNVCAISLCEPPILLMNFALSRKILNKRQCRRGVKTGREKTRHSQGLHAAHSEPPTPGRFA
jgi:hypothetical protein